MRVREFAGLVEVLEIVALEQFRRPVPAAGVDVGRVDQAIDPQPDQDEGEDEHLPTPLAVDGGRRSAARRRGAGIG